MAIEQNIYLAADNIVTTEDGYLLLIQRKNPPFQGQWAFPGGFVEDDEELAQAAVRELNEETGLEVEVSESELVDTVGTLGRDPRFRTVSVVYHVQLPERREVGGADDAADARWFPLSDLPELGFDHRKILNSVLNKR